LAKLQILNRLPADPAEAADDIVSFGLVDFLLHASSPQGTTELTADHVLPDGADRVRRGAYTAEDEPDCEQVPGPGQGMDFGESDRRDGDHRHVERVE
jgi:hypothetical protein